MYIRILDLVVQPGLEANLTEALDRVRCDLRSQKGYRDLTVFRSYCDPRHFIATSFWDSKAEADQYRLTCYPLVRADLEKLLSQPITVRCMEGDELMFARRLSQFLGSPSPMES